MIDWNWFFSSTSQSTAAIVAIFAGFIITKIINAQNEFHNNKKQIVTISIDSDDFKKKCRIRNFKWYNRAVSNDAFVKIAGKIERSKKKETAEIYYKNHKEEFSKFQGKNEIIEMIGKIILNKTTPIPTQYGGHGGSLAEKEKIHDLALEISKHCGKTKILVGNLKNNPESSLLISWSIISLIFLFYFGVVLPLLFLPVKTNTLLTLSTFAFRDALFSLKGAILAIISIIFTFTLLYFFFTNLKMKYSKKNIEDLTKYSTISNYSKYLKNMTDNETELTQGVVAVPATMKIFYS